MIEILPIHGLPEVRPGDNLVELIVAAAPWLADDDVLIVTSKIVSKAEGRLVAVTGNADERESARQQVIDDQTVRLVARRGTLKIVETYNGLVLAAAGVDASNVRPNEIALLPLHPDESAAALRAGIAERTGLSVAVVLSDSVGRPWRHGISDVAIGVAGLTAVSDIRGENDEFGNELVVTEVALADELAAAGDLVKGKLSRTPVAVVRGLSLSDDGLGSSRLLRGSSHDLFRLGTAEALAQGRAEAGAGADAVDIAGLHADVLASLAAMELRPGSSGGQASAGQASGGQAALREAFFGLLAARPDATRRACAPGHITASTVLLDDSLSRVLLTLHPRIGRWVQLGGHLEDDDASLVAAAGREAREESGMDGIRLDQVPLDLDVHPITCSLGIPTRHFDVRFVGRAPAGAVPVMSAESRDLRWFSIHELPDEVSPEVPALVAKAAAAAPDLTFRYLAGRVGTA